MSVDEPEAPNRGLPPQEQIDAHRGYRVTKWGGFDNFECLKCQYATLWVEKIHKHLFAGRHEWAFPSPDTGRVSAYVESDKKLEY